MARRLYTVEQGLQLVDENGFVGPSILKGSGLPGGSGGEQDDAVVGSIYLKLDGTGGIYKKIADNNLAADWEAVGEVSIDELSWRNETVVASTNDTLAAGSGIDPTAWTDNDQGLDGDDIPNGSYILGDVDGTPVLFQKTAQVSATSITLVAATQVIAANDTFVVQNHLPDPGAAQEAQAILHFPNAAGAAIKIADFNWALADGINLTSGYVSANGTVAASDTVETAISKLDGNQGDLITLSGEAQGAVDHGTFTGDIIQDNRTTHEALQDLENFIEADNAFGKVTGITTLVDIDTVLVDDYHEVEWELVAFLEAAPAQKQFQKLGALHDGTASADAANSDIDVFAKKKLGANFNIDYSVDFNGVGAAQTMRLRAASTTAGVTVEFRRNGVKVN